MVPTCLSVLAVIGSGALARAGPIESVEVVGSEALSQKEVLDLLGWSRGESWSVAGESLAVRRLFDRYAEMGYFEAEAAFRVDSLSRDTVAIEVSVREGAYLPLTRLGVEGSELLSSSEIRARLDTRPGKSIRSALVDRDLDRLLLWYARSGYPFCRVLVTDVTREKEPDGIGLTLRIVEGPFLTLGGIRVTGNKVSRLSTIRRLSGLRFDEPYDQQAVDESRGRLLRSRLFRSVEEPVTRVEWKEKRAVVELAVEESKTNRIAGVIGYAPGGDGRDAVLSGFVDLSFRNILGTARRGEIHWEQTGPQTRNVRLAYREPWVLGSAFGVGGEVEQTLRDSTYSRSSASITVDFELSRRVVSSFTLGGETMRPRRNESPVPRSARKWGSVAITYDGRDNLANPTRGLYLRFGPEYAERSIEGERERGIEEDRVRQATMDAALGVYRRLRQRTVLAWEISGLARYTDADFVPVYDQFYLGGARTLRGYDEDLFRGSRLGWSRLEVRYLLGILSRVFLFFDSGYIYSRRSEGGDIVPSEQWKTGYGLGLRVESGLGILGIDYGLGEGDGFQDGKVHVSALGEF